MAELLLRTLAFKKTLLCGLVALSLAGAGMHTALAAPVSVKDGAGDTVSLPQPATRVVTLAPHLTEIMYTLEAGDLIVGTTPGSDFPAAAKSLKKIGDDLRPDAEQVLLQHPDLILAWQSQAGSRALQRLREQGIPVYISNARSAAEVATDIRQIGALVGHSAQANQFATAWNQRLHALSAQYGSRTPVRVFYQIWPRPLYTIGGSQFISVAIHTCGGINVFARIAADAPVVSREAVLAAQPDLLLTAGHTSQLQQWRAFPSLPAIRLGQLVALPPDLLSRPGPRLLDGIDALCQAVDVTRSRLAATTLQP